MKKRVLILANNASGLYDFRNELVLKLLEEYEVHVSLPDAYEVPELEREGCCIHHTPIDRRGINPLKDMILIRAYRKLLKELRPSMVLTYTIKPNIYGNLCCRMMKIPYIANITGLGSVFENGGMLQKLVVFLYKVALKKATCIFFQNEQNKKRFEENGILKSRTRLVSGSGVNLDRHSFEEYPTIDKEICLTYVGRIMKEKGIEELLYASKRVKEEYPDVRFRLIGNYEDDYKDIVAEYVNTGIVTLTEYQKDIHPYYKEASGVLMPSYHEGMSNVILEASATGRPVLASNIPGCKEGFEDGVTGIGFEARSKEALYDAIVRFLKLSHEERMQMGKNAREKMKREFDRQMVVQAYMEEIESVCKLKHKG